MEIGVLHSVLWSGNRLFCTPFYGTETGIFILRLMKCYETKVKHKTFKRFRNDCKKDYAMVSKRLRNVHV